MVLWVLLLMDSGNVDEEVIWIGYLFIYFLVFVADGGGWIFYLKHEQFTCMYSSSIFFFAFDYR